MGLSNITRIPDSRAENLLPIVVRDAMEHNENRVNRYVGFSSCCQLILCIDGEGIFIDHSSRSHRIRKGDMFFVTPGTPHHYEPVKEPWRVKYVTAAGYELDGILESLNLPRGYVLRSGHTGEQQMNLSGAAHDDMVGNVDRLMSMIIEAYESEREYRHLEASAYFYKLLVLISECGRFKMQSEENRQNLEMALLYIKQHFSDTDLSSEDIAKKSGMSSSTMNRVFKNVYGMSPHEYVTDIRLQHAKTLLCSGKNETLQKIAEQCGFRSDGYFIKVFRAKNGITPAEFRTRNMLTV